MKRLKDVEQFVFEESRKTARDWFLQQSRNPFAAIYLYYCPGKGKENGYLSVSETSNHPLGDNQRLSPAWTEEQCRRHIAQVAKRLPILAPED